MNEKATLKGVDKLYEFGKSDPASKGQLFWYLQVGCLLQIISKGKLKEIENSISEDLN